MPTLSDVHARFGDAAEMAQLQDLLALALSERNRLNHSFYREHNVRRNTEEGRTLMLKDPDDIRERIGAAFRAVLAVAEIEITEEAVAKARSGHLPH